MDPGVYEFHVLNFKFLRSLTPLNRGGRWGSPSVPGSVTTSGGPGIHRGWWLKVLTPKDDRSSDGDDEDPRSTVPKYSFGGSGEAGGEGT